MDVITHVETYDVTTIRASTPMFLMSRKIKALGVKMVLSGEGSDEVFGGYLYFHKAPNRVSGLVRDDRGTRRGGHLRPASAALKVGCCRSFCWSCC
jgi:asparagine synthetase B (glutamine-hydrolysing)